MTTKLVAAAALASFWGCSTLVPGLRMDEDKVEKRGKAADIWSQSGRECTYER